MSSFKKIDWNISFTLVKKKDNFKKLCVCMYVCSNKNFLFFFTFQLIIFFSLRSLPFFYFAFSLYLNFFFIFIFSLFSSLFNYLTVIFPFLFFFSFIFFFHCSICNSLFHQNKKKRKYLVSFCLSFCCFLFDCKYFFSFYFGAFFFNQ